MKSAARFAGSIATCDRGGSLNVTQQAVNDVQAETAVRPAEARSDGRRFTFWWLPGGFFRQESGASN